MPKSQYLIYFFISARYDEILKVARKKTNLMFVGDGKGKTIIAGNKSIFDNVTTFHTATFGMAPHHHLLHHHHFLLPISKASCITISFIWFDKFLCPKTKVKSLVSKKKSVIELTRENDQQRALTSEKRMRRKLRWRIPYWRITTSLSVIFDYVWVGENYFKNIFISNC